MRTIAIVQKIGQYQVKLAQDSDCEWMVHLTGPGVDPEEAHKRFGFGQRGYSRASEYLNDCRDYLVRF